MSKKLNKLKSKLKKETALRDSAKKSRKKQLRKFEKTGDKGHSKLAAKRGKETLKRTKKIEKLKKKISAEKRSIKKKQKEGLGKGAWGGSKSLVQIKAMPIARKWGIKQTSSKRWATYGNPSSDHYMLNTWSYAKDFATTNNYAFGVALGKALGVDYNGAKDDYKSFYVEEAGRTFRVQIICGTHGTGPHTHLGIRRIS
jgi:hypothetical protein